MPPSIKKLTIITIVYNGEKHIRPTIESVIQENYPNTEYIIIDGGSRDHTLSIINGYRSYPFIKVLSEKDEGISDAFNKGLKLSTGDVIGFINADDWYEPGSFAKVMQTMEQEETDIVYGQLRYHDKENRSFVREGSHKKLKYEMTVNHPTVFARRKCYQEAGMFDLRYRCAMDYDMMIRFYKKGYRFTYLPTVISNMRLDGLSDRKWMMGIKEVRDIKNAHFGKAWFHQLYFIKQSLTIIASKAKRRLFS